MARCLITGATGFIGSHAVPALSAAGWEVHTLVRPPSRSLSVGEVHYCDSTDQGQITALVTGIEPDVVIHLATNYIRDHQPEQLEALMETNVSFGCRILEAMVASTCRCLVTAGTAWQHMGQTDDTYCPATLYAATKQAFEDIARWYTDAHGLRVTALHLGDTYGPEDPRPKFFTLLAAAARSGQALELSPGEQRLDPLHVFDAAAALELAARRLHDGQGRGFELFQATPRNPLTLRELASLWCVTNDASPDLRWGAKPYREREVMLPWQGGVRLPGWVPKVTLDSGLRGIGSATR